MMKKFLTAAALAALTAAAAFATPMSKQTLIVGTSGAYPPYEFHDKSGALAGFDIDMTEAIA